MDGALRAYANRMALLGMTCGVFALGTLALFAYVRLQPPVVIRVDNSGEATVVGGDTVKVGANGLMGLIKVSASRNRRIHLARWKAVPLFASSSRATSRTRQPTSSANTLTRST